jgi:N-acetyl-gamma-glutamyl-phosphate reductase
MCGLWIARPLRLPPLICPHGRYGLTELFAPEVAKARLVANPGCYPTSVQLPLVPLVSAGLIEVEAAKGGHIVIDAKSGTSGAGRATGKGKEHLLYAEAAGSFMAYGIGSHRHMPEIEQGLVAANGGNPVDFSFTPHLVPMTRGILATMYVQTRAGVSVDQLREHLADTYANAPFVHVLPAGKSPATAHVRGSNRTLISVTEDRVDGRAVVVCVIDNLVKGASGAAIQNMNVQFGWPESTGLDIIEPIFP